MTPATAKTSAWANWVWPDDVKAFAAEHQTEAYLEPLKDALARLFPTASAAKVILELDPELRDDRHITFEVEALGYEVPEYLKAMDAWHHELFAVVPDVKLWVFRLNLIPLD